MDLSIIIVNYNTKKLLEQCLSSIYKFTSSDFRIESRSFVPQSGTQDDSAGGKDINFEVIVIDNGSKDGSLEMVKKKYPQVKLIPNKDNLGFSRANNQGIKVAKGKYILLLNSDTYLIENSFKKLIEKAESLPNVGALAPQLLNEDKSIQQSAGFFPHLPQVFFWMTFIDDLPGGQYLRPYHVDHDSFYNKDQEVDWLTAAAVLIPKDIARDIKGLDEKIFMYGEDVDFCYRVKKAGFNIYLSPVTKIVHIGRGSSGKIPTAAFVGEYKGLIYFYAKHKGKLSLQIAKVLLKIGALLRIGIFSILGRKELASAYGQTLKAL